MQSQSIFGPDVLLEILSLSENATAIYSSGDIVIENANKAMLAFWGRDESVIGQRLQDALPELEGQPFIGILKEVWRSGKSYVARDMAALLPDGKGGLGTFYFDFVYKAIPAADGSTFCILHTATDVTARVLERKRAELSESNFLHMTRHAPVALAILSGSELRIDMANDLIIQLWGKNAAVIGKPLLEAIPEMHQQPFPGLLQEVFVTGVPYYGTETRAVIKKDATAGDYYFNFVYYPLRDVTDSVTAIMIVATDVTEQVQARKRIQESEHRLKTMIMTTPIGMTLLKGRDLVIEVANEQMLGIWQKNEDIIGCRLLDEFPELVHQPFPDLLEYVFHTGKRFSSEEMPVQIINGDVRRDLFVRFSYDPLCDLDGKVESILATVMDVTTEVQTRREIEKTEEMMRLAIASAQIGTFHIDVRTRDLLVSDRTKEIFGFGQTEVMTYSRAMAQVPPEFHTAVSTALEATIQQGLPYLMEHSIMAGPGRQERWIRAMGQRYSNQEGTYVSGVIVDITEQKITDYRKDEFIGIASHEMKTPVTSLKVALQLMDQVKDQGDTHLLHNLIARSNASMNKLATLIDDLLDITAISHGKLQLQLSHFNLYRLVCECRDTIAATHAGGIHVTGDMSLLVEADEHRIGQVVSNFISNAIKYASATEAIRIHIDTESGRARVTVSDKGPGINAAYIPYIFDRYFRIGEATIRHSGLGLGLYISAEIVKRHQGTIGVESEPGLGSAFWFSLPLHQDAAGRHRKQGKEIAG